MLGKALVYISNAKHEVKRTVVEKLRSKSGMEMLQMVILIAIAISIAALFFVAMQKFFPEFWGKLEDKINDLFGDDIGNGGGDDVIDPAGGGGGDEQKPPIT